ncbi:CUAEP/CCAEP-tail radical SAM protein [bacterium]|nr:CUAEP/CCAEP-tail radical SAM protein [bacterium]
MKILLISCYELGHQPFNLASPAAHLLAAGFDVKCLDLAVEPFDEQRIREAKLVAFSTPMHTALRLARKVSLRVRALNPECHVCFYGLYAGMHSDLLLGSRRGLPCADSVIGGEFETPLVQLARDLSLGLNPTNSGIKTATSSGGTSTVRQEFLVPARHLLPSLGRYVHLVIKDRSYHAGYVEASRGCAHRCLHCPITSVYNGRFRIVQKDVVLADIEQLVELGAKHVTFGDPDFLNGVKHSLAIVRKMQERFPFLTLDFTTKIEHILEYQHLFTEFRKLGSVFVVSAVELLNDEILRLLEKDHTRENVQEALQITRNAGVALRPSLMPFTPWTTIQDLTDLLDFIEINQLYDQIDPIQLSIRLLLPPGSSLLNQPELQAFLTVFDCEKWVYEWRSADEEMDLLQNRIAGIVESESKAGADNFATYLKISQAVAEFSGDFNRRRLPKYERKQWAPRLTEDWFC